MPIKEKWAGLLGDNLGELGGAEQENRCNIFLGLYPEDFVRSADKLLIFLYKGFEVDKVLSSIISPSTAKRRGLGQIPTQEGWGHWGEKD